MARNVPSGWPDEALDATRASHRGVEGHPLEDGADQVGPGRPQRQVVEAAPGPPVVDRRALAGQPRGEQQPPAARRGRGGQRGQLVVGGRPSPSVVAVEAVAQPLEGPAARLLVVGHQAQSGQDARARSPSGGRRRSSSAGTGSSPSWWWRWPRGAGAASTAPDPTHAEWRSGVPATTTTPSGSPRSAATVGPHGPDHAGRRPERRELAGRHAGGRAPAPGRSRAGRRRRLSVSHAPAIEAAVAAAVPVKRMDR